MMGRFFVSFGVFFTSLAPATAAASEVEQRVASAFATEYAKEQLKHQLAEFLNRNPQVVFSSNPTIGNQSIRFLSQVMATYGLLTAKTDRERAWHAAYLIITPEPTTAAILVAAQLTDTLLSIKAQARVAQIRKDTAEIQAQALRLLRKVATAEAAQKARIIADYDSALVDVEKYVSTLTKNGVYQKISAIDPAPVQVTEAAEIEAALAAIGFLDEALDRLERSTRTANLVLDSLGIARAAWPENQQSYNLIRDQIKSLESSFRSFFTSLRGSQFTQTLQEERRAYATQLRLYKKCISVINAVRTQFDLEQNPHAGEENQFLWECRERFFVKGSQP